MSNANITNTYTLYCNPNGARRLAKDFQPGKYDVLCARGKKAHESEGNRRFRALVKQHQENYAACTGKVEKSKIVSHIVKTVRHASPEGGFVKIIDGEYWEAGDRTAKEKVGQTFRDLLHTKYSSSTKAKARARMERKEQKQPVAAKSNMLQAYREQMSPSPDCSATSIVSDDSFSNNEDSSFGQLSPIPQPSMVVETPSFLKAESINLWETLRSSSLFTMDQNMNVQNNTVPNSKRNSLLCSSICTIQEPHQNMLRSNSIHSFAGNGVFDVEVPARGVTNNSHVVNHNIMNLDGLDLDLEDIVPI